MKILGIDYGERKIGVAVGNTNNNLSEPLIVIRFDDSRKAIMRIKEVIQIEKVEKLAIGISEGKTAEKTKEFAKELEEEIKIPIVFYDETLSTHDAQKLSIEGGVNGKKRRKMEDAYAAAIMLQNYIETRDV